MEIREINNKDILWNKLIEFADKCSWRAGSFFAKKLRNNDFANWERVFIATIEDHIIGYCTFTEKDCILSDLYTPFIGFIFIDENFRGQRTSQKLINEAINYARENNFKKVYIASGEIGLYEKYGFRKIDEIKDKHGNIEQIFSINS